MLCRFIQSRCTIGVLVRHRSENAQNVLLFSKPLNIYCIHISMVLYVYDVPLMVSIQLICFAKSVH